MSYVRLHELKKTFPGPIEAVAGIDLEIHEGEFLTIVGPSGCGKSTLLRLIVGLEVPTGGTMEVAGRVVNGLPPHVRDTAMVFQDYALYPHLDVRQNIAFGLKHRRITSAEISRRIDEVLGWLQLEPLAHRHPAELSGGERQRVALGRAIVREPKVFLFDEPLANLDPQLRDRARTELASLQQRLNATVLYVTHDQQEAMALGHRVAVMNRGRLEQVGTPREVFHQPVNRFVASFMGHPGMNFLPGSIVDGRFTAPGSEVSIVISPALENQPAELGVRPDDLLLGGEGYPLGIARVDRVEWLGVDTLVYLSQGELKLVSRVASTLPIASNTTTAIVVRRGAAHLFATSSCESRLLTV